MAATQKFGFSLVCHKEAQETQEKRTPELSFLLGNQREKHFSAKSHRY